MSLRIVGRIWLAGALGLSVLLSACAPSTPASNSAAPTTAAQPAATQPAAAQPAPTQSSAAKPGAAAPAGSGNLVKLTIGHGAVSATDTPFYVADDLGLYAKYGIQNDDVQLTGGSQVAQGLASGSVQIAGGGLGALLDAKLSGVDLTVIGSPYPWQFFQIYAQPGFNSMEDLRGKTIAASDPGSSSDRALIQVGQKYNMTPGKDFNVIYVGGTKERVQVLEQKVADASIISPPNGFIAGKEGFVKVVDLIADKVPFGYAGFAVNTKFAQEHPDQLENFFKAYLEGMAIAKSNKAQAKESIAKHTQTTEDDVLEEAYNVSVAVMPLVPALEPDLVKLMLDLSDQPAAKTADPTTLYDNSLWNKISDSGFLKTLPGAQ
jgi:ABC-type nitrate/sulfonate/bicarbonate transport system substrate-binding protein